MNIAWNNGIEIADKGEMIAVKTAKGIEIKPVAKTGPVGAEFIRQALIEDIITAHDTLVTAIREIATREYIGSKPEDIVPRLRSFARVALDKITEAPVESEKQEK